MGLMMYSAPTPPEGVVAEVAVVDDAGKAQAFEGKDVAGKIVLTNSLGLEVGLNAFGRGAVGIVSDAMKLAGSPQDKGGGHFDHAAQWHNYTVPPWKMPGKGFGFALTPANGRRLRELLRTNPSLRLRAVVKTRLYAGVLPLVTGLLPGESSEEIALTGHLCEPGANDNNSGCALGLEVVRTLKALAEAGKLPKLKRGIRQVYSFEVRGYQAFLANWPHLRRLVAGLNLDMVGNDQSESRSRANLLYNWAALPGYTDALALALLRRLGRDDPLLRFRTESGALVDNLFGDPAVGAPTAVLGSWPDAYYHTSLDTLEHISPRALAHLGRVAATYCGFLATAGFREAAWLARQSLALGKEEVLEAIAREAPPEQVMHVAGKNAERIRSVARLVRTNPPHPTPENRAKLAALLCPWSGLVEDEELAQHTEALTKQLDAFARREVRALRAQQRHARKAGPDARPGSRAASRVPRAEEERGRRIVPKRLFQGALCFESLDAAALQELKDRTGLAVGWGVPQWLQLAMFQSTGKRTALDIWRWLQAEGCAVEASRLNDTLEFLARHGFVKLRPVLRKADILAALRAAGVQESAILMAHTSLSEFGYIEGGADALIDALLEAIGPRGTLAMPTLSFSWLGRRPYDPKTTPARIGAVPNVFRQRPGVLRSAHPTHSVAALGPKAAEIVSEHCPEEPVFGPRSPYARLYELDACIIMLCKLGANTTLHMAEERAGLLLTDSCAIVGGREVLLPHMPCHARFEPHHELLRARGQLHSAPLGEGAIHLMRVRHAVDAALGNLRRDPLLATGGEKCQCTFCQAIRAQVRAQ